MDEPQLDLETPRYGVPTSGWILTAVGAVIALALLLWPRLADLSFSNRIWVTAALVALPITATFLITLSNRMFCFWRRGKSYDSLVSQVSELNSELANSYELAGQLIAERQTTRALQIKNCYCDNGDACLSLYLKKGFALEIGDQVDVVDQVNSKTMGRFKIIDRKPDHYVAKAIENVDPIWLGDMKLRGAAHCAPPTNTIAMKFQSSEDENA